MVENQHALYLNALSPFLFSRCKQEIYEGFSLFLAGAGVGHIGI